MINYIKSFLLIISVILLSSCEKDQDYYYPYPCADRDCDSVFYIDQVDAYLDNNGYWHTEFFGPRYFTIAGKLDQLDDEYIVNEVPLVEVAYDSNYWVAFDDLSFTVPLYSPFGLSSQYGSRISVAEKTYNIGEIAQLMEPLNIAGYQITKNTCFDCPYSDRLFATYSKYTYKPRQQFYLDDRMVGDTLEVYVKATFNTDLGESIEMNHTLKIIID